MDKKLAACANTPNCVSSQATDNEHFVPPFKITGDAEQAWAALHKAIQDTPRMVITHQTSNTLHAEATSFIFRFVDDIDAILDEETKVIHVRSASRVGHSDFGVNRKRIEALRSQLKQARLVE